MAAGCLYLYGKKIKMKRTWTTTTKINDDKHQAKNRNNKHEQLFIWATDLAHVFLKVCALIRKSLKKKLLKFNSRQRHRYQ